MTKTKKTISMFLVIALVMCLLPLSDIKAYAVGDYPATNFAPNGQINLESANYTEIYLDSVATEEWLDGLDNTPSLGGILAALGLITSWTAIGANASAATVAGITGFTVGGAAALIGACDYIGSVAVSTRRSQINTAYRQSGYHGIIVRVTQNPGGYPVASLSFSPWY